MKATQAQINRAARKTANAFDQWNTSNFESESVQRVLLYKMTREVVKLLNKLGAFPPVEKRAYRKRPKADSPEVPSEGA